MIGDGNISSVVAAALDEMGRQLNDLIIESIEADDWEYRRDGLAVITRRKNRDVVTSPRDIVDLGTLRDRQNYVVDGKTVRFVNDAPHAQLVHEGGSNGNAEIPARPFMTRVLADVDLEKMVAEALGYRIEEWASGRVFFDEKGRFAGRGLRGAGYDTDRDNFSEYYGNNT